MAAPRIEDFSRVLVVEGYSDLLFFAEILEDLLGPDRSIYIKEMGGKGNLKPAMLETFLAPGLLAEKESVAVVADADSDAAATGESLRSTLRRITGQSVEVGSWTTGKPRVGLFVAPGACRSGEIETLVWEAWSHDPANSVAGSCVDAFVDCMRRAGAEARSPDKARVGALLAVRNDEDPRLGPGARSNVFDLRRPEFGPLTDFLRGFHPAR